MTVPVSRSELTPVSFLRRAAEVFPDRVAIVHGDRRLTYRALAERVDRFANRLRADGLRRHDRVAVLCPNIPAMLEAHLAVPAAGGVLVPINTRLAAAEIDDILRRSRAGWLFVDAEQPQRAELEVANLAIVRVDDTGAADDPYEVFLRDGSPEPPQSWLADENEPISICYTSGTTGQPRGVVGTHRGAYLNALANAFETRLGFEAVYLWTLPMFHCHGWCGTWATVAMAATSVCLRRIDPAQVWALLAAERVTHFSGAPTVHIGLVNHPAAHRLPEPVTVAIGGAPPSPTLLTRMRELNLRPIHLYGLTETYGPIAVCEWHAAWDELPEDEQARLLARQGHTHLLADAARVVDGEMRDVPRDGATPGELVVRGNTVMQGYDDDPAATATAFRGGWFHTGDVAVWHPDGAVELRDRLKDVIISGGENISTIEVEQTIARHPAVLECAVVAMPDERWGERPKAFVTLKPGQTADADEIVAFCRQHLAGFKCPAAVSFGDLPKTSTGKVQKYLLREREWAGRARRIN